MTSKRDQPGEISPEFLEALNDVCKLESEACLDLEDSQNLHTQLSLLKCLINAIPSPISFKDHEGRYLGCNRSFEDFIGLKGSKITGKLPSELQEWDLGPVYEKADRYLLQNPGSQSYQTKVRNHRGELRDLEVHHSTFKYGDGTLTGIVGIDVDVTEQKRLHDSLLGAKEAVEHDLIERSRKLEEAYRTLLNDMRRREQAEEARRLSEARFQKLFESMVLGVVYQNSQGKIVEANPAALKILGVGFEDLQSLITLDADSQAVMEDGSPFSRSEFPATIAMNTGQPVEPTVMGVFNPQLQDMSWLLVSAQPCFRSGERQPFEVFSIFEDITDLKQQAEIYKSDRDFTQTVLDTMDAIVVVLDPEANIVSLNRKGQRITGYSESELVGEKIWSRLLQPETIDKAKKRLSQLAKGQALEPYENYWVTKYGENRLIAWSSTILKDADGQVKHIIGTGIDVTERKEAEDFVALSAKVFENVLEGVSVTDADGNIEFVNRAFTIITGYPAEEAIGKNPSILKSDRHGRDFYAQMWSNLLEYGEWHGEVWNRRKTGEAYPEWLSITAVKDSKGMIQRYVAVFHDISDIKKSQEQLEFYSNHDALTGLPNRNMFKTKLEAALEKTKHRESSLALVALDIDNFRNINDTMGHMAGDQLLQMLAKRINGALGDDATVTRLGGDQFLALLEQTSGGSQAAQKAQAMLQSVAQGFTIDDREVFPTVSIGIAMSSDGDVDADTLIINADLAMHRAKGQGKNAYSFYTKGMNSEVHKRLDLENDLRQALERREFRVLYQPKLDVLSGQIKGMEALIRWVRPDGQIVSPLDFIPLAEETGLIIPIGRWVLEEACQQNQAWRLNYSMDLKVAVNVSVRQFMDLSLYDHVMSALQTSGLPPDGLELELTESALMVDTDQGLEVIERISNLGVSFALDDFGTGYSSLAYLHKLPMSSLKIDKSFVENTPNDRDSSTIVATIIAMAHATRMKAVAEGVETKEQLSFLMGLNCDEFQGYLHSPPLSALEFDGLLQSVAGG
jgi:diguanylate cyclase (GGDEF)-like protein/PAS domain S-box-containing protein